MYRCAGTPIPYVQLHVCVRSHILSPLELGVRGLEQKKKTRRAEGRRERGREGGRDRTKWSNFFHRDRTKKKSIKGLLSPSFHSLSRSFFTLYFSYTLSWILSFCERHGSYRKIDRVYMSSSFCGDQEGWVTVVLLYSLFFSRLFPQLQNAAQRRQRSSFLTTTLLIIASQCLQGPTIPERVDLTLCFENT